jgi:hypothetical protein
VRQRLPRAGDLLWTESEHFCRAALGALRVLPLGFAGLRLLVFRGGELGGGGGVGGGRQGGGLGRLGGAVCRGWGGVAVGGWGGGGGGGALQCGGLWRGEGQPFVWCQAGPCASRACARCSGTKIPAHTDIHLPVQRASSAADLPMWDDAPRSVRTLLGFTATATNRKIQLQIQPSTH